MEFLNKRKLFLNDQKQENLNLLVEHKHLSKRKKAFESFLLKTKKPKNLKKNEQEIFEEIKNELNINFDTLPFNLKSFMIKQIVNFIFEIFLG